MTNEVVALLERIRPRIIPFRRVALLSPSQEERRLFPDAMVFTERDWDLSDPRPDLRFDLIIACHVFHYSTDPARWFASVLGSCRALLLADLIWRQRSPESEFGPDGDAMRFAVGGLRPPARVSRQFDLDALGDRLLAHTTFNGGSNQYGEARHLLAFIRGDLTAPLFRLDDYPTGVRPILPDLTPIHGILDEFERRQLPYHLGIVPGILDEAMVRVLKGRQWLVPAQHGFDHRYPHYSALLLRKGDPFNARGTVGGFDEFRWQGSATIARKLGEGKDFLERRLERPVKVYIPPCNRCNRATARALHRLGFKLCLSERRPPGRYLPSLRSGFYGKSGDLRTAAIPEVIGLHLTWEWDQQREGDAVSLGALLDRVVADAREKEAAIMTCAGEIPGLGWQ